MATWINPYLYFDNSTREAFQFYHSIFGGKLDMVTGKDFGMEDQADRIMHAHLETEGGWTFMGSDGEEVTGEVRRCNLTIGGDDSETDKAQRWFDELADGGQVLMPLERQQWGSLYGAVQDKFGVTWALNFGGE